MVSDTARGRVQLLKEEFGHELRRLRKAANLTQDELGQRAGYHRVSITQVEKGRQHFAQEFVTQVETALDAKGRLLAIYERITSAQSDAGERANNSSISDQLEELRQGLNDALSEGTMSTGTLNDWEETVLRYGRATRDRPASVLIADLTADLAELKRTLVQCRSASSLRRLTRVAAQMSGLICLTLIKLDDRRAFRGWARVARVAAHEVGDSVTGAWVLAHEAYGHYYSGDFKEAIDVAQHAQVVAGKTSCVAGPLAAALEARAHAVLGHCPETQTALTHAEELLGNLDGGSLVSSAFGYNEAQFRFHEGNAYTHLRQSQSAVKAQERALQLCAPGDYMDETLIKLDRVSCLAHDGDISAAMSYATETLLGLTAEQRCGIIIVRAQEILSGLPRDGRASAVAREFEELLRLMVKQGSLHDS